MAFGSSSGQRLRFLMGIWCPEGRPMGSTQLSLISWGEHGGRGAEGELLGGGLV